MIRSFDRDEGGQALIVIAVGVMVLLLAAGLAVDVGNSLTLRRVSQNQADAAVLAVGKLLATSVSDSGGGVHFTVSREQAWCLAREFVNNNRRFESGIASETMSVSFASDGGPWTAPLTAATCPASGPGTAIPAGIMYTDARVRAEQTSRSLTGGISGQAMISGATAQARIAGAAMAQGSMGVTPLSRHYTALPAIPHAPTWPLTRHFDATEYSSPCGLYCDPNNATRLAFWPPTSPNRFGEFRGLLTLSHLSTRFTAPIHQYQSESDYTGSFHDADPGTAPVPNQSLGCSSDPWDTAGSQDAATNLVCGIPNWFYYGYRGAIGVDSSWSQSGWGGASRDDDYVADNEAPTPLTTRGACAGLPTYFAATSCGDPLLGDWIETAFGDINDNMVGRMREYIAREGREVPFSSRTVVGGPNAGNLYGRAVVMPLFVWDCGERYYPSSAYAAASPGDEWDPVTRNGGNNHNGDNDDEEGDCSRPKTGETSRKRIDRVHIFAVIPFTFYEGLVTSTAIEAYWGGAYAQPGRCEADPVACAALNPLINTAFLVRDD
jgi:hypothetical protein